MRFPDKTPMIENLGGQTKIWHGPDIGCHRCFGGFGAKIGADASKRGRMGGGMGVFWGITPGFIDVWSQNRTKNESFQPTPLPLKGIHAAVVQAVEIRSQTAELDSSAKSDDRQQVSGMSRPSELAVFDSYPGSPRPRR
jgi:hypothetical protein